MNRPDTRAMKKKLIIGLAAALGLTISANARPMQTYGEWFYRFDMDYGIKYALVAFPSYDWSMMIMPRLTGNLPEMQCYVTDRVFDPVYIQHIDNTVEMMSGEDYLRRHMKTSTLYGPKLGPMYSTPKPPLDLDSELIIPRATKPLPPLPSPTPTATSKAQALPKGFIPDPTPVPADPAFPGAVPAP
jgi:hypothetical protein